ncbi:hypothetical protein DL765_007605 [Monosporascus sp. GIB2]|nr:hypothetical protein DL765_007605 [Monosporascus sp. GIB2]
MPAPWRSSPVTRGRINGVTIYRVDHPETGCSAGFWATRVAPSPPTSSGAVPGETRIELDFQHAAPERCGCVGRDADAPAVRALLGAALSLSGDGAREEAVALAMLAFLKRVLRLPALGDAELDLWDELHWPCSEGDGGYGEYDEDAAAEVSDL